MRVRVRVRVSVRLWVRGKVRALNSKKTGTDTCILHFEANMEADM